VNTSRRPLDATDLELLRAVRDSPRASHAELARVVDIARGTVYSRLDRLVDEGVITGFGPDVDAVGAGLGVLAFATLEISQGTHAATTKALAEIVEIVEIHTVTGAGDLLCRIVARSNDHLHDVLQRVTALPTVGRCATQLALATSHRRTIVDVLLAD
jgi:DNA-binding Lrp family transcriptional regulator